MIATRPADGPWSTSTVGAHFDVQLGKMLDAERNAGEPKPYLGNRAVQWGSIDVSAAGVVPLTREDQVRFRLKTNDLLVCEGGEVGRAAIWRDELDECYYQKALHRLRAKAGYNPQVMMAYLEYWAETHTFDSVVTQTSIAHLPRERLLTMPLPDIPPLEQERIAKVFDDVGGLIARLERLVAKKEAIKRGIMQQLLTGKTRLPGFVRPWKEWSMGSLGKTYGGLAGKTKNDFGVGLAQYVPFMAVITGMRVARQSLLRVHVASGERQNAVKTDDLLFNTSSETPDELALCAIAGDLPEDTYLNSFCFGFRLSGVDTADPLFIAYLFRSEIGRRLMNALAQGAIRFNLSRSQFRNMLVILPSVNEQRAIAGVLESVDSDIGALRDRLTKAKAIKQGMMQELLTGRTRIPIVEEVTA